MRKLAKLLLITFSVYLLLAAIAGVVLGEASLKLVRRPLRHQQEVAALVSERYHASLQDAKITAADGSRAERLVHPSPRLQRQRCDSAAWHY